jgi:hypothetical protein
MLWTYASRVAAVALISAAFAVGSLSLPVAAVENMKGLLMMGNGQARAGGGSDGWGGSGTSAVTRRLALSGIALGAAAGLALAPVMAVSAVSAHAAAAVSHARLAPCPCTNPVCQSGC